MFDLPAGDGNRSGEVTLDDFADLAATVPICGNGGNGAGLGMIVALLGLVRLAIQRTGAAENPQSRESLA